MPKKPWKGSKVSFYAEGHELYIYKKMKMFSKNGHSDKILRELAELS
jgi:hypothetical protein